MLLVKVGLLDTPIKICLVTTFPPSKGRLNEYGFHLAKELQQDPAVKLTILADEVSTPDQELSGFNVLRCWSYNSLSNPLKLLRTLRKLKPDVVWFNLVFPSFGDKPVPAFFGLSIPAISRLAGFNSHVTLHHLMESVDLADAGVRFERLYRIAGRMATRILLRSNSVSVLLPAYRRVLMELYKAKNVNLRLHGIFSGQPEPPDYTLRGNPEHKVLALGEWGTYKRLEVLLEAFSELVKKLPSAKLVIAGRNHPLTPNYVESVLKPFENCPWIEYTGYVSESSIPSLFRPMSIVVLPYSSATGPSGVAHLACEHAVPMVASDLPDFHEMAAAEGMAIDFFPTDSPHDLTEAMYKLLTSPERLREMAEQNFAAALRMTMPAIIQQYRETFSEHAEKRKKSSGPTSRWRSTFRSLRSMLYGEPLSSGNEP